MKFIGLRLCEHDSNVTYSDGKNIKYYKPERDYQIKHFGYCDLSSWIKIIKKWKIDPKKVDAIGIVLDCFRYPNIKCNEKKLYEVIDVPIFKLLGFECPIFRIDHHYAHSLSDWPLGIDAKNKFVFDGFGDDFITHSIFCENKKILEHSLSEYPSLGRILGDVGKSFGLKGNSLDHAGKIMAMKAYGKFSGDIDYEKYNLKTLFDLWDKDNFLTSKDEKNVTFQKIFDHVYYCHNVTEKIYVDHFKNNSQPNDTISYSGGIAQNTVINSKIKKERPNFHVLPHCNDEGLTLGIVEFLRIYFDQEPFDNSGFPYWQTDEVPETIVSDYTIKKTAELLSQRKIVGWYQGKGELGPRALGNRSILMDPTIYDGKQIINEKVKNREFFRPFGASILEEKTSEYFDWNDKSPYMLYVMDILDKKSFPSITHADGTCRIQTVSSELTNYYSVINEFEKITGIPMLLNTSLNNGGKPIAGSINDAMGLFANSDLDVLVIGDLIYEK